MSKVHQYYLSLHSRLFLRPLLGRQNTAIYVQAWCMNYSTRFFTFETKRFAIKTRRFTINSDTLLGEINTFEAWFVNNSDVKLELYKRREAARSYNSDYTSTWREKCMEYKWYDVSQRVNEPHYATHGKLETIRKRGNSPCCEPHMLEPLAWIPDLFKALWRAEDMPRAIQRYWPPQSIDIRNLKKTSGGTSVSTQGGTIHFSLQVLV